MRNYEACKGHIANGAGPGTDLNRQLLLPPARKDLIFPKRNFDFAFKSNDPGETYECSESYQGPAAFSEKETQAMKVSLIRNNSSITMKWMYRMS